MAPLEQITYSDSHVELIEMCVANLRDITSFTSTSLRKFILIKTQTGGIAMSAEFL